MVNWLKEKKKKQDKYWNWGYKDWYEEQTEERPNIIPNYWTLNIKLCIVHEKLRIFINVLMIIIIKMCLQNLILYVMNKVTSKCGMPQKSMSPLTQVIQWILCDIYRTTTAKDAQCCYIYAR